MAYLGTHMYRCSAVPFNWNRAHLVVVSGSGPNFCGHAIINAGFYYFHIDGLNARPWYMPESGYQRYLKENKKESFDESGCRFQIQMVHRENWKNCRPKIGAGSFFQTIAHRMWRRFLKRVVPRSTIY